MITLWAHWRCKSCGRYGTVTHWRTEDRAHYDKNLQPCGPFEQIPATPVVIKEGS